MEYTKTVNIAQDYSEVDIKKIISHFDILFDLNYALPNSLIQETTDGYVFSGKKENIYLTPKEAYSLLLKFKRYGKR